jgi:ribosomal protein RSM22 (predicted rRNA methylase)
VLERLAEVWPDFAPATLLDVGAGTGAASWAARQRWPEVAVTMLDTNGALRDLAGKLMPDARLVAGDLAAPLPRAGLAIASYVLAELPLEAAAATARHLWAGAGDALALVEPGTPAGFARIRAARAALIEAGAHIAAPCTHDHDCPMARSGGDSRSGQKTSDWCHFSQRLARSRDHMRLKDAHVPFEDERYSYLVVTRDKRSSGARILSPPLQAKPGLAFKLCDETGLRAQFVPTRDKDQSRRLRRKDWGDLF